MIRLFFILLCFVLPSICYAGQPQAQAKHVILISFDGLRPDAITALGPQKAGAFYKMIKEGASTLNARTDYDYTVTIPNHTTMITGYPVMGPKGHYVIDNTIVDKTVHDYAGRHVYSVFDVLHQHDLHSAMLASKKKFNIFSRSFPIDFVSITDQDDLKTLENFGKLESTGLPDFVLIHFVGTDITGHKNGWNIKLDSAYLNEVQVLDQFLAKIIKSISNNFVLKDSTVVIVTSDHGGDGFGHSDNNNPLNYTIPFMIWGNPVAKGLDLYTINADRRKDPFNQRIPNDQQWQPIYNGDAANLVLSLLSLPAVEGSSIGDTQPLKIN
ncbi:MAG: alkaline phosphatase family protein, partial [Candidatus Omnitrophota bacterium]